MISARARSATVKVTPRETDTAASWAIVLKGSSYGTASTLSEVNPKGGFYAEYAAVKALDVSRIPDNLTTSRRAPCPWTR